MLSILVSLMAFAPIKAYLHTIHIDLITLMVGSDKVFVHNQFFYSFFLEPVNTHSLAVLNSVLRTFFFNLTL